VDDDDQDQDNNDDEASPRSGTCKGSCYLRFAEWTADVRRSYVSGLAVVGYDGRLADLGQATVALGASERVNNAVLLIDETGFAHASLPWDQ
jgi:hypothetical protein